MGLWGCGMVCVVKNIALKIPNFSMLNARCARAVRAVPALPTAVPIACGVCIFHTPLPTVLHVGGGGMACASHLAIQYGNRANPTACRM